MSTTKLPIKSIIFGVSCFIGLLVLLSLNPFASNNAGEYQVVQTQSGKLWVQDSPKKWYWTGPFAKVETYPRNVTIQVGPESKRSEEADYWEGTHTATFAGGDEAQAGHTVKWNLPLSDSMRIKLHQEYTSIRNLKETTLLQYQKETMNYSTQRMESESHYSSGNAQLKAYFYDQLRNGHVLTKSEIKTEYDTLGNPTTRIIVQEVEDKNGQIIRSKSDIQEYNITPSFASIDYIKYDKRIEEKLQDKIDAAADESTSKQRLITAQQEAETAKIEGRKLIEETRATQESAKLEAVIVAQREREVAEQRLVQAKLDSEAALVRKRADAEGDRLKVAAGLTPLERATIEMKTAIGIAEHLSKRDVPMIINGGGNGGSLEQSHSMEKMLVIIKEMQDLKDAKKGN